MYHCQDCGCNFETAFTYTESHGLTTPPFEKRGACPECKGEFIVKTEVKHCKCCGARLTNNNSEYCDDTCRQKDIRLRWIEAKERQKHESSPLWQAVREVEEYNRTHKTHYSYGQYMTYIKPKLKKE